MLVFIVTHLRDETSLGDSRVQYMVDIDGQNLQEASFTGGGDGIGRMVGISPCVGAVGEAAVGEMVDDAFVGVLLGAHKH